jgi:GNAT superfamily N-acetyltransferase
VEFQNVEENLRLSFRALAVDRPRGEVREIGGISIASAGTSFQMFNAAFLNSPVADASDLERRIATARVQFEARALEWSFWMCEGLLPPRLRRQADRIFSRNGLRQAVQLPGMCADRLLPPRRPLPALDIRRVKDEATRVAFCDIGCTCFHVPLNWFREIFLRRPLWENGFVGWVGYLDAEPVVTAATVTAAGVIGVYNVATLPQYRRRGHGEAVVRYALDQASRECGFERTILQATDYGLELYLSMGYRTVTTVKVYASD